MNVFSQIFAWDEYACLRSVSSPRWILDLGANAGYSSAYFLSCFPTASVIAVEPDTDNCKLCRTNLAQYGTRARVRIWPWAQRFRRREGSDWMAGSPHF